MVTTKNTPPLIKKQRIISSFKKNKIKNKNGAIVVSVEWRTSACSAGLAVTFEPENYNNAVVILRSYCSRGT